MVSSTGIVFSERFLEPGQLRGDPLQPNPSGWQRIEAVWDAIQAASTLPNVVHLAPRAATVDELEMVHTADYIRRVREYSDGAPERGDDFRYVNADTVIASNTYELASLAAGGVFTAIDAVQDGTVGNAIVIARPGDHHAYPARGEGFCIFNHTALGARYLQRRHGVERVLIVDWDVHHGNGTQAIFYSDPTVFTYSIHSYGTIYPRSGHASERGAGMGQGTTLNVTVDARTRDRAYLEAFRRGLKSIRFVPDFVLIVAGFDGHRDDPLGNLDLSDRVFPELTHLVKGYAERTCGGRLVSILAGGYNLETIGALALGHLAALRSCQ
jgi:acetoin utilization deacetylase AcuC-like enzyme